LKRLVARNSSGLYQTPDNVFTYQNIPGAGLNMVVPPGSDCIFVHFNSLTYGTSFCLLRALINGVPMEPGQAGAANGRPASSNQVETSTHSWSAQVTTATQATNLVQIQVKSEGPGNCNVTGWQLEVYRYD
jgi:hypothetical protein